MQTGRQADTQANIQADRQADTQAQLTPVFRRDAKLKYDSRQTDRSTESSELYNPSPLPHPSPSLFSGLVSVVY